MLRPCAVCLLILATLVGLAEAAPPPDEDPNFRDQMKEAVRLHDAGDYAGAMEIYHRLVKIYPDDGRLLYEMAFTASAQGSYKQSIDLAEKALKHGTPDRAACYSLMGSDYDFLEKYDRGEKTFRRGLEEFPDSAILHFNFGINLAKQRKFREAESELQEDLRRRPAHPGGWISLAKVEAAEGAKAREFLAYVRFLTVAPDSPRSREAAERLWPLLFNGVESRPGTGADGKTQVSVTLSVPDKAKEKSSESQAAMVLALVAAGRFTDDWKDQSDSRFFAHALETLGTILAEADEKSETADSFWESRVSRFLKDAKEHGHLEVMAYDIRRSLAIPEDHQWLAAHADEIDAYRAWVRSWKPAEPDPESSRPGDP